MKKNLWVTCLTIIAVLISSGCGAATATRYDGPYEGRIIDADTGRPIEGVVVLGVWYKQYPSAAGAISKYYDATETVTDKNGEFRIKGLGLLVMSNIIPMDFQIFKSGYEYLGLWPWESLKKDILLRKIIKWEGNRAIIPLKKLTMGERKKRSIPDIYVGDIYDEKENITHSCLPKNIKLLPNEINKELLEQGLKPYDLEGGQCKNE